MQLKSVDKPVEFYRITTISITLTAIMPIIIITTKALIVIHPIITRVADRRKVETNGNREKQKLFVLLLLIRQKFVKELTMFILLILYNEFVKLQ